MPSSAAMARWQDAEPRVEQHHARVGRRGAGGHVAGVLRVPGRIGEDELAPRGGEVAIGDVDGDALLALSLEAVGEEREIDLAAEARGALDRRHLVIVERSGLVEQPADERRLAVVDRAERDDADQLLDFVGCHLDARRNASVRIHQKYPSRFFSSIEPSSSWSMTRPCRSEWRLRSISSMISGTLAASDSMAPLSG